MPWWGHVIALVLVMVFLPPLLLAYWLLMGMLWGEVWTLFERWRDRAPRT